MRAHFAVLAALLIATCMPAAAQVACIAGAGSVPPCMVGIWSGSNDMVDRLRAVFDTLPPEIEAAATPESGQYLFLRVQADGRFVTSPTRAQVNMTSMANGGMLDLQQSYESYGMAGFMTAGPGDALSYCKQSSGPDSLTVDAQTEGGSFVRTVPVPAFGTSGVPFRYECGGAGLAIYMDLPPPVGTITFSMTRVPESAVPAEFLDTIMGD